MNVIGDFERAIGDYRKASGPVEGRAILARIERLNFEVDDAGDVFSGVELEKLIKILELYSELIIEVGPFRLKEDLIYCEEIVLDAAFKCFMQIVHVLKATFDASSFETLSQEQLDRLLEIKSKWDTFLSFLIEIEGLKCNAFKLENDQAGSSFPSTSPNELAIEYYDAFVIMTILIYYAHLYICKRVDGKYDYLIENYLDDEPKLQNFVLCLVLGREFTTNQQELLLKWKQLFAQIHSETGSVYRLINCAIEGTKIWWENGQYPTTFLPSNYVYVVEKQSRIFTTGWCGMAAFLVVIFCSIAVVTVTIIFIQSYFK